MTNKGIDWTSNHVQFESSFNLTKFTTIAARFLLLLSAANKNITSAKASFS